MNNGQQAETVIVGLRVDVDTYRGTRDGVPELLRLLAEQDIKASFFFSVGPDNMGRHLWRLLKPAFLIKMLRSNAASLYGWDILLRGTFWPGPMIGKHCEDVIRQTDQAGHEVGLHAWDHHRWQAQVERMNAQQIRAEIQKGITELTRILGKPVICSAAAGWKCTEEVLVQKRAFGFFYNSDCRGRSLFKPVIQGRENTPQIPVTLPTYDEIIGREGIDDTNYNQHLLGLIRPGQLNVLTIHAEVEGIARAQLFTEFLHMAKMRGIQFVPLGRLLANTNEIPPGAIKSGYTKGREGRLCMQSTGTR